MTRLWARDGGRPKKVKSIQLRLAGGCSERDVGDKEPADIWYSEGRVIERCIGRKGCGHHSLHSTRSNVILRSETEHMYAS